MIEARNLEQEYGRRSVLSVEALRLAPGTVTALVGPNGSGKSTLLRLLGFVERPSQGTISLDGHPVASPQDYRRARRRVTLVEQHPLLFRGTVRRNLLYALRLHGISGSTANERTVEALERVGVADLSAEKARSLSAGQVQRVAIARALALRPDVLLLDEPASSADRGAVAQLYRVIEQERERRTTVCFATHHVEDAYRWSEHLVGLTDGSAGAITPENLVRTVIPPGNGLRTVQAGPLEIQVFSDKTGPATIMLPPNEITVSRRPLDSSARNRFRGRVTHIAEDGRGGVTLHVDVGIDLVVRITRGSLHDLGIELGAEVYLSIKAMAVQVF